ncbi:MAG TPA: hypothetical protein VN283_05310 [Thiobacillus sp.]|nr:hypothetical protein [Thiobacillus sp.]
MPLGDFRSVFMPYCLRKQEDGRYVVLNREYKPVGFFTHSHVKYDEYPVAVQLEGIGPATAAKLSWKGDDNPDEIFLYNDGCVPTHSAKNMDTYLAKLQILAKLKIKEQ